MTQFARDFVTSIEGTNVDISTKELSGGARVYYIFNDVFGNALASIDPTQSLENQDIRTAIRNSTGPRPSLFVPEVAFTSAVPPFLGAYMVSSADRTFVLSCRNCNVFHSYTRSLSRPSVSYCANDLARHRPMHRASLTSKSRISTQITPRSPQQQLNICTRRRRIGTDTECHHE